ncbi:MAG: flagellar hook protein FlgE, partial [Myxococcota bacterium]
SGFMQFDDDGELDGDALVDLGFTPKGAQETLTINFDLAGTKEYGDSNSESDDSSVIDVTSNGSESGAFSHLNIAPDGTITGTFSTGAEKILGQIAVARFNSNSGLKMEGAGMYRATSGSGDVILGAPNAGGRGSIMAGTLEQSTVDLASEFTTMIIAQRGYQANSRSITTADQVIQEAVNLKR